MYYIHNKIIRRKNAYGEICDDEEQHPCPNLIVIGTTQV